MTSRNEQLSYTSRFDLLIRYDIVHYIVGLLVDTCILINGRKRKYNVLAIICEMLTLALTEIFHAGHWKDAESVSQYNKSTVLLGFTDVQEM